MFRRCSIRFSVAVAALSLSGSCTPTLEFQQCRDNDDCANALGRDLVCSESHECIERPSPEEIACTVHSDCFALLDSEHVCTAAGACAALRSDECTEIGRPEGVDPNDVVYVAALLATSPPFDTSIGPIKNAVVLAVEDFNREGALPGGRKAGWVVCDTAGNAEQAVRAAEHVVRAGIPAIVGPTLSDPVLRVAEEVAIPSGTFLISPTATNKTIAGLDDEGLVWRTISSDVYQASALADVLGEYDPPVERVLVLAKDDGYGIPLSADFLQRGDAEFGSISFGTLRYPDPTRFSTADALRASYGNVIAEGYAHQADTVVLIGTNEVRDLVLLYLTAREAMNPRPPLPRFIVSHGAVPVMTQIVESSAVTPSFRPTLMSVIEGVSPIIQNAENFEAYNIRYTIRFLDEEPLTASSLGYDATMVTLLAMVAAGEGATGASIAENMPRLTRGTAVPFGDPAVFVPQAVDALLAGDDIDVQGVSGELDFDAAGEIRTDLVGWGMVPRDGQPEVPVLVPLRRYVLDGAPATDGAWMDLSGG
jgi:ABC-type branched-subunit amino acid transport system substrate-binding protein